MATDALTAAILQGLDPGTYRSLSDIQQGNALQQIGQDASPTSKWGALGRLANAAAGTYLSSSATSDLAKTIAGGKKSAQDQLLAAIEAQSAAASPRSSPVPMAAPAQAAPSPMPAPSASPQAAAAPTMAQAAPIQPAVPAPASPYDPATFKAQADQLAARTNQQAVPLDAPAAPAMAAAPGAASAPPPAVAAIDAMLSGGKTPRGVRNNNPLNIEDGPFAKSQPGYAGSDGRFAKFGAPEHGIAAASSLLDSYDAKHGLNTVAGIVNRWAPPSDGNNTSAYAADVAGKLGIDPNAPVPKELRPQLIAAMASHENGVPFKVAQAAPQTMNDATSAAEAPTAAARSGGFDVHKLLGVLQNPYTDDNTKALVTKLLAAQLTPKEDEFASSPQGIFNKTTGELKKQAGGGGDFGGLQGPELMTALKQANPPLAAQTQAVLEGRVPYPSGSRLNPQQQQLKELVTQIDPNFTAANAKVMQDTLQDYGTKGRTGQARVAANTMLGHADTLNNLVDKLGNYTYFPGVMNKAHDIVGGNTDPEYQTVRGEFETTKKALSTEAEKALAGHTTLAGINEQMSNLDRAKSPEELHSAIHGLVHVLGSRLESMASGFDTSMKTRTQGHEFLDPKGREIFNRFEGINAPASTDVGRIPQLEGPAGAAPAAVATGGPKAISSKQDYDALPSGSSYVAPDGSVRTKK